MTVSTTSSQITVGCNGSTSVYSFPFIGVAPANVIVSYVTTSGIQTLLPSTAYSVSLNAPVGGQIWGIGGTVTYPLSGPNISSGSLIIQRILPLTQSAALSNQGNQYPIVTEEALDTLCMEIQQIASQGGTYRGVWASGINYKYSDIVQDGSNGANTGNLYLSVQRLIFPRFGQRTSQRGIGLWP